MINLVHSGKPDKKEQEYSERNSNMNFFTTTIFFLPCSMPSLYVAQRFLAPIGDQVVAIGNVCPLQRVLSSPSPQPLSPQSPQSQSQPSSNPNKPKRGLGLTLKFCRPPITTHRPLTLKHEEGVPQKSSENKNGPE